MFRTQAHVFLTAAAAVYAMGCESQPQGAGPETQPQEVAVEEEKSPGAEQQPSFVTAVTGLRVAASEARRVSDASGKQVSNWQSTLHRGEVVEVLETNDDWSLVRASDDAEGWLKSNLLLPAKEVTAATLVQQAKTFSRPDLLAIAPGRTLEPASLVFVLRHRDQFSEVNFSATQTAWVQTNDITTDEQEVEASKILTKVNWLRANKREGADELMTLVKTQFATAKVLAALEAKEEAADSTAEATEESGKAENAQQEEANAQEAL